MTRHCTKFSDTSVRLSMFDEIAQYMNSIHIAQYTCYVDVDYVDGGTGGFL